VGQGENVMAKKKPLGKSEYFDPKQIARETVKPGKPFHKKKDENNRELWKELEGEL
jgi:hypothetical protein